MSTRRLEMSVEQLKNRTTSQLAELGRKTDAINRLKAELDEKTETILALEARDKTLRDQLRTGEEEFAARTTAVQNAERALADKQSELARMMSELDERSVLADSQKIEIVALRTQLDSLKERLSDAENEVKAAEERGARERAALKEATAQLTAERGKVEDLGRRVAELEQKLVGQITEAERLGRRAHDLEARLTEQSAELARVNEEPVRDTDQTWPAERAENALLRERINDVAAEVARLASALEGPNSPINAILAQEDAANIGRPVARAGGGNLAERIRALQSRASRLSRQGEPTRN
jgi:chromosome segregation ATPase